MTLNVFDVWTRQAIATLDSIGDGVSAITQVGRE